jgi:phosphopantothenoylcysteine decarboxylase/phosphopantothenate--cysteine ligase
MNTHMYENRVLQRNIDRLKADGKYVIEPGSGELACGTSGPGRLPEPADIFDRLLYTLHPKDLVDKKILVTAGPTREHIDPVRFISNPSSGKMGYAVARAAEYRGGEVCLVAGPTRLNDPNGVSVIRVQTARKMAEEVLQRMEHFDIIIKTAAVSDYRPKDQVAYKIKKDEKEQVLTLERNLDILKELGKRKGHQIIVGFAAETENLERNAAGKMAEKRLDMIAGNLIGEPDSGFETDMNTVTLFYKDGAKEALPAMPKDDVAHALLDRIAKMLDIQ